METGRKLPRELECPVDVLFSDISEQLSPYFKKLNFNANDITTLSLIFGILAVKSLIQEKFALTGVFYLISYYFDCMDGYYARKYNMISDFGDKYDHYKDWTIESLIILILFMQKRVVGVIVFSLKILCSASMIGCQEQHYEKKESKTLNLTYRLTLCKTRKDAEKVLRYHRFCGVGTTYLIAVIYFLILEYYK